jgi:hypothetical protein
MKEQLEVHHPLLTEEQMEQINFTLIEALHTNKQVYLTYYKNGQRITEIGFIQFVDSLGNLFVFIDDVFELKNKMRLNELFNPFLINSRIVSFRFCSLFSCQYVSITYLRWHFISRPKYSKNALDC